MSNNLAAFNSEAWSSRLVRNLDQVNVVKPLANTNWEGDLRQNKTVWIRTPGSITMNSYTRGTQLSYTDLAPTKESFSVNDGEYFAFQVDDIDKAQSDVSAMDVYMKRAVVAMNNKVEEKILAGMFTGTAVANQITSSGSGGSGAVATATVTSGTISAITVSSGGTGYTSTKVGCVLIGGGGSGAVATVTVTTGTIAAVTLSSGGSGYVSTPTVVFTSGDLTTLDSGTTSTGIYQVFTKARAILSNQNVPADMGNRFAIVDPDTTTLLLQDTAHFVRATSFGDAIVQNGTIGQAAGGPPGFIGRCAGFDIYETPHVVKDIVGSARYLQFGDREGCSYAAQITEIEALRLQSTFADAVRGLLLHDTFVSAEMAKRLVWARVA